MPAIIDELYAGVLDRERLSDGLARIVRLTGAAGGMMYNLYRGEEHMRFAVFSNMDLEALHNADPETVKMLPDKFQRLPLCEAHSVASAWPIEEMKKTAFYRDILQGLDILHGASGLAVRNSGYYGLVILTRSGRQGPFSDDQFSALQALIPHIRNVLQIENAMGAIANERAALAAALDGLSDGVVLTDSRGKVVYVNRAAERMIATNDGLSIKAGFLGASNHDEERALHCLVGQASTSRGADSFERGGSCTVRRPSGAPPWVLLATPCCEAQALAAAPRSASCAILIRDRPMRERDGAGALRQAYGLTFQESKVALAIAEGGGLAEAARSLGLSVLTVRNHLQRVFDKTGANRQAALARLVARLSN